MILKPVYIALFALVVSGCNTIKERPIQNPESQITKIKKAGLMAEGFTAGVIQENTKKEDCQFTILVSEQNKQAYFLDPINLAEAYKKNGLAVFFKYRSLRMMSRCQMANPVEIQEIQIH